MTTPTLDEGRLIDAEAYAFAYGVSVAAAMDMFRAKDELERLQNEHCAKSSLPESQAILEFYRTPEAAELYEKAEPRHPKRSKPVQTDLAALYLARASLHHAVGHEQLGKVTAARLVNAGLTLLMRQLASADPKRRDEAMAAFGGDDDLGAG